MKFSMRDMIGLAMGFLAILVCGALRLMLFMPQIFQVPAPFLAANLIQADIRNKTGAVQGYGQRRSFWCTW